MRYFRVFIVLALVAMMTGVASAQQIPQCGICKPVLKVDSTAMRLDRVDKIDRAQNARIANLKSSLAKTQRSIEVLVTKVLDLEARPSTDTSVTNELTRTRAQLAQSKAEQGVINEKILTLVMEQSKKVPEKSDTKHGVSNGAKWAIGLSLVALAGVAGYAISRGGSSVHIYNPVNVCVGNACR